MFAVVVTVALLSAVADPAEPLAAARAECDLDSTDRQSLDRRIAGCTALLNSEKSGIAHARRGDAYAREHNYAAAIADFTAALESDPHDIDILDARGRAFDAQKDYAHAMADASEMLKLNPRDVRGYALRATAQYHAHDFAGAIADLTESLRIKSDDPRTYAMRAGAYALAGDNKSAIADRSEQIRLDPHNPAAFEARAIAYVSEGQSDRALADYTEAIRLNPGKARYYSSRCWIKAVKLVDLDAARADCDAAIAIDPNELLAFGNRGIVDLKQKRFKDAVADFTRGTNSDAADAFYGRGIAELELGQAAAAQADIAKAKSLDPKIAAQFADEGIAPTP